MPGASNLFGRHVVIEGNIASGKSTLCHDIHAGQSEDLVHVCRETTDELFLKHFYQDPAHYAFSFQAYMLKTRLFQMMSAVRIAREEGKLVLMDRGALGDTCFAKLNWLHGKMDDEQWELYEKICNEQSFAQTASESVDCIVYLDVEPADCLYRVQEKRKTASEQMIPLSYFEGIDDMYFDLLLKVMQEQDSPKVMVMRWGEFGSTEELVTKLDASLSGERRAPRVYMNSESDAYPACCYNTPEEIQSVYKVLAERAQESLDLGATDELDQVRIKWDMCYEDKSSGEERCPPQQYHSNSFKRVVLYHLSLGQDIHFY